VADEKIGLGVGLSSTGDTSGVDKMTDALDKNVQKGKEVSEVAQKVKLDYTQLGETLRNFVEAAGVIEFLRESVKEFYEDEKAIRAVNAAALAWGDDSDVAKKKTEEWTRALSLLSGVADNELTLAVGKAYAATGDLSEAMRRAKLATDIVSGGGADNFATAMKMVEQATNGAGKEIKLLVPEVAQAKDKAEFAAIAIKGLSDRYSGLTEATHDNAKASDLARVKWELFQKDVGSKLLPAINWIRDGLTDLTNWWSKMGQYAGTVIEGAIQQTRALGTVIELLLKGKITEAGAFFGTEVAKIARNTASSLADIDRDFLDKKKKNEAELLEIVKKGAEGQVTANKDLKEKTKKILDETQHYDLKSYYDTLAAHQKAYDKHVAWMKKEGKHLIDETIRERKRAESAEEEAMRKSREMAHKLLAEKKKLAKEELAMQVGVAQAGIALAGEVFGASKAVSVAQAVVSTYQAAAGQLGMIPVGPWNIALAAIMIATGLAQVAKIVSTEPESSGGPSTSGGGFDDPQNDQAAYMGGRRWAGDMISKFTSGVSQGWAEGMGARGGSSTSITNNNQRSTTLNVSMQDPSSIEHGKKLLRTLKMIDSNILGQTTIAARTR
jgi:hypothetical protein